MPRSSVKTARKLRNTSTPAETLLWQSLRKSQLHGYKFTRQHPVGRYVVDFCCRSHRVVVEVDGGQHDVERGHDASRTAYLHSRGYAVLRVWNNEVLSNLDGVLKKLSACLENSEGVR